MHRRHVDQALTGTSASQRSDLALLLHEVLEVTVTLLGADSGTAYVSNERDGTPAVAAQIGFAAGSHDSSAPYAGDVFGREWPAGRPDRLIVEDVLSDPRFADSHGIWTSRGCRAIHSVPIVARTGKALGTLCVYFARPNRPSEQAISLLDVFAQQAERIIEGKRAEEALRGSETGLRLALEAGQMGAWDWNIRTGHITWSANLEPMHGLVPGTFGGTFEAFQALIHPDDRESVLETIRRCVESRAEYETEFRNLWPDASVHWILGKGKVLTDERGEPLRMIGVCTDITKRKRAEETARDADRRKDEFLAMISHELRNPLAAISSSVSLLDRVETTDALSKKARSIIRRQTEQLTKIVGDLLDIARLTAGKVNVERKTVDLGALVARCVGDLAVRGELEHHRHELRVEPALVTGDATRLEQILTNLLTNALKYTPPGGTITVEVQPEDGEAVLRVSDTGIGIAPELLPHVFDLFVQSERGLDRRDGGLGVGLSVVRRLVEAHGGRVEARSPGLNRGSEFLVRLPLVASPAKRSKKDRPETTPSTPRRILVVDDNPDTREGVVTLLRLMGHVVHEAEDGPGGLESASQLPLDVALIDIGLPGFDGFELAQRLRATGSTLRLIALTGYGQPAHRRLGAEVGFDAYLVKPVGIEEVLREVLRVPAV